MTKSTARTWWTGSRGGVAVLASVLAASAALVLFPTGCDFDRVIKVPLSHRVSRTIGESRAVTLRQAPKSLQQYLDVTEHEARTLAENIADAQWWAGFWQSLTDLGLTVSADAAGAAFPGLGGLAAGLIAAVGAANLRKPRDARKISDLENRADKAEADAQAKIESEVSSIKERHQVELREKMQASYNKGQETARMLSSEILRAANITNGKTPPTI